MDRQVFEQRVHLFCETSIRMSQISRERINKGTNPCWVKPAPRCQMNKSTSIFARDEKKKTRKTSQGRNIILNSLHFSLKYQPKQCLTHRCVLSSGRCRVTSQHVKARPSDRWGVGARIQISKMLRKTVGLDRCLKFRSFPNIPSLSTWPWFIKEWTLQSRYFHILHCAVCSSNPPSPLPTALLCCQAIKVNQ